MALFDQMVMGRERRVSVQSETTPSTRATILSSNGLLVMDAKVTEKGEKVPRRDFQGRSLQAQIDRKIEADFELSAYILPPGGNAGPDIHPLLSNWFGGGTAGGSDFTYSIDDDIAAASSLTIEISYPELDTDLGVGSPQRSCIWADGCVGGVVNEMELKFTGGEEPMVTFKGPAIRSIHTGTSHVPTDEAIGQTTISVADARQFSVGSQVSFAGTGNQNRIVTAVDTANNTITINAGLTTAITGGAESAATLVQPSTLFDVADTTGDVAVLWSGSVSLFGVSVAVAEATIKCSRGIKRVADQYGTRYASFFIPVHREVTGELTLYSTKDAIRTFMQRRNNRLGALSIVASDGGSTPKTMTVNLPNIELDFDGSVDVPAASDGAEARVKIMFKALATDIGESDEIEIVFA